ncbi:MAG: 3-dehydroquinate synthase [Pyrinomonadaceae bacterium]
MQSLTINLGRERTQYEIIVGADLNDCGKLSRRWLGESARRVVIVSNKRVYTLYGLHVAASLATAGFTVSSCLIGDGERYKSLRTAETVLTALASAGTGRTDAVIALGGGVVGDVAGFAAAVHLRGIRFIQIPTTLLAMIDSSVGGKTGVNTRAGKNLAGAFHQPSGVLIDPSVLATLDKREVSAGMYEAVKHAAISGKKLFRQTAEFLTADSSIPLSENLTSLDFESQISNLILENIRFKAHIVAGDERETTSRSDPKSRKILNFGHTLAHALEKVTDYKLLKHGEAVGYGILFAAELSKSLALCDKKDVELLNDVLHRVGPLPRLTNIDPGEVLEAFKLDKKQLSGSLQMVLLTGLGQPTIIGGDAIPPSAIKSTLTRLLRNWS